MSEVVWRWLLGLLGVVLIGTMFIPVVLGALESGAWG